MKKVTFYEHSIHEACSFNDEHVQYFVPRSSVRYYRKLKLIVIMTTIFIFKKLYYKSYLFDFFFSNVEDVSNFA